MVAGLGTRFLPATKSVPKAMLTLVDKPVIEYLVEEALASGIREIIFVMSRDHMALKVHYTKAQELENHLKIKQKKAS